MQAIAEKFWVKDIQSNQMHSKNSHHRAEYGAGLNRSDACDYRRRHRQQDAQVWNEAQKAADKSDEVKKRKMQNPENDRADCSDKQADQDITGHEAADHGRNQTQSDIRRVPVFEWE